MWGDWYHHLTPRGERGRASVRTATLFAAVLAVVAAGGVTAAPNPCLGTLSRVKVFCPGIPCPTWLSGPAANFAGLLAALAVDNYEVAPSTLGSPLTNPVTQLAVDSINVLPMSALSPSVVQAMKASSSGGRCTFVYPDESMRSCAELFVESGEADEPLISSLPAGFHVLVHDFAALGYRFGVIASAWLNVTVASGRTPRMVYVSDMPYSICGRRFRVGLLGGVQATLRYNTPFDQCLTMPPLTLVDTTASSSSSTVAARVADALTGESSNDTIRELVIAFGPVAVDATASYADAATTPRVAWLPTFPFTESTTFGRSSLLELFARIRASKFAVKPEQTSTSAFGGNQALPNADVAEGDLSELHIIGRDVHTPASFVASLDYASQLSHGWSLPPGAGTMDLFNSTDGVVAFNTACFPSCPQVTSAVATAAASSAFSQMVAAWRARSAELMAQPLTAITGINWAVTSPYLRPVESEEEGDEKSHDAVWGVTLGSEAAFVPPGFSFRSAQVFSLAGPRFAASGGSGYFVIAMSDPLTAPRTTPLTSLFFLLDAFALSLVDITAESFSAMAPSDLALYQSLTNAAFCVSSQLSTLFITGGEYVSANGTRWPSADIWILDLRPPANESTYHITTRPLRRLRNALGADRMRFAHRCVAGEAPNDALFIVGGYCSPTVPCFDAWRIQLSLLMSQASSSVDALGPLTWDIFARDIAFARRVSPQASRPAEAVSVPDVGSNLKFTDSDFGLTFVSIPGTPIAITVDDYGLRGDAVNSPRKVIDSQWLVASTESNVFLMPSQRLRRGNQTSSSADAAARWIVVPLRTATTPRSATHQLRRFECLVHVSRGDDGFLTISQDVDDTIEVNDLRTGAVDRAIFPLPIVHGVIVAGNQAIGKHVPAPLQDPLDSRSAMWRPLSCASAALPRHSHSPCQRVIPTVCAGGGTSAASIKVVCLTSREACPRNHIQQLPTLECHACPSRFVAIDNRCVPCPPDAQASSLPERWMLTTCNPNYLVTSAALFMLVVALNLMIIVATFVGIRMIQGSAEAKQVGLAAEKFASAMAELRFDRLAFLDGTQRSSLVIRRLLACVAILKRFRNFIPGPVLTRANDIIEQYEHVKARGHRSNAPSMQNAAVTGVNQQPPPQQGGARDPSLAAASPGSESDHLHLRPTNSPDDDDDDDGHSSNGSESDDSDGALRRSGDRTDRSKKPTSMAIGGAGGHSKPSTKGGDGKGNVASRVEMADMLLLALTPHVDSILPCAVLCARIAGFSAWVDALHVTLLGRRLGKYQDTLLQIIHQMHGEIDAVHGDTVCASWNTTKRLQRDHVGDACQAAYEMASNKVIASLGVVLRVGVASSAVGAPVIVGRAHRKHHVLFSGDAAAEADALAKVAKKLATPIVVPWAWSASLSGSMVLRFLCETTAASTQQSYLCAELMAPVGHAQWNYEMRGMREHLKVFNAAMSQVIENQLARANSYAVGTPESSGPAQIGSVDTVSASRNPPAAPPAAAVARARPMPIPVPEGVHELAEWLSSEVLEAWRCGHVRREWLIDA